MSDQSFVNLLCNSIHLNMHNIYCYNIDPYRFPNVFQGWDRGVRRGLKNAILKSARHAGFVRVSTPESESISRNMSEVIDRVEGLGELY